MPLARTLEQATPALDPDVPLESDDPRYVDFSEVRGGVAVLRLKKSSTWCREKKEST